jgi:hypothetical protein
MSDFFFLERERRDARHRERSICSLTSFRGPGKDSPTHVDQSKLHPRTQDPGYKMPGKAHVTTFPNWVSPAHYRVFFVCYKEAARVVSPAHFRVSFPVVAYKLDFFLTDGWWHLQTQYIFSPQKKMYLLLQPLGNRILAPSPTKKVDHVTFTTGLNMCWCRIGYTS